MTGVIATRADHGTALAFLEDQEHIATGRVGAMSKVRFRCPCGYEADEEAHHGHVLVAVYHLHYGQSSWGAHPCRMEAISQPAVAEELVEKEMATVA